VAITGIRRIIVSVADRERVQPWGERQAVLTDPDGHVFCLVCATA
jgi:uncharacterized glyoxalase superfamily protein PhnB